MKENGEAVKTAISASREQKIEKIRSGKFFAKGDLIVFAACILLVGVFTFLAFGFGRSERGTSFEVISYGETIATLPLGEDAEYLYTVPWAYKDYRNYEKGLLREAVKDLLPEDILWRKKSPYPKTHNPAYLIAVQTELQKVLDDSRAPIYRFVKRDALRRLLDADVQQPWYGQLMTTPQTIAYFVQLNYWLEKFRPEIRI